MGSSELAEAVAAEVREAVSQLPEREREALELREERGLTYAQMAGEMGTEDAAVARLLANARLGLREQRRGGSLAESGCDDRARALEALARRQDSEELSEEESEWLLGHLGVCDSCSAAHAAMLEASYCYRAAL
jgi:Sigma-70, region 4